MSDEGPDDPRWVAAITPKAHREIHYGANGETLNKRPQERLKAIEPSIDEPSNFGRVTGGYGTYVLAAILAR